jgi:hypothetical protein
MQMLPSALNPMGYMIPRCTADMKLFSPDGISTTIAAYSFFVNIREMGQTHRVGSSAT